MAMKERGLGASRRAREGGGLRGKSQSRAGTPGQGLWKDQAGDRVGGEGAAQTGAWEGPGGSEELELVWSLSRSGDGISERFPGDQCSSPE